MDTPGQPSTPITITIRGGEVLNVYPVRVETANEVWSEYRLEDGTTVRVKPVPSEFYRAADQYDSEGNPSYFARIETVFVPTGIPSNLRRQQ